MQSLGRPEDRRCVASFGGAAREWLTERGFMTKFQIVLEHMLCCHLCCFYRYVRFPGVRRPSRELAHRRVLLCSPTRFATDEHHHAFSTLAYALGRDASAVPAGQELKEQNSELWESKRLAWRAGCELGGKIGTRTAQIHVSLRPPTTHTLPPECALQATVRSAGRERATISALLDARRKIDGPAAVITYKGYEFFEGYCTLTDAGALETPHPYPAPIAASDKVL